METLPKSDKKVIMVAAMPEHDRVIKHVMKAEDLDTLIIEHRDPNEAFDEISKLIEDLSKNAEKGSTEAKRFQKAANITRIAKATVHCFDPKRYKYEGGSKFHK